MICRRGEPFITTSGRGGATCRWQMIHDTVRVRVRQAAGREPHPSGAIVDSKTVRTSEQGGARGYDGAKKVSGLRRHLLVDTLGLVLLVVITAANVQDREGASTLLRTLTTQFWRLRVIWADGAYASALQPFVHGLWKWGEPRLEIVRKSKGQRGFAVVPWRWIVERAFAGLGRHLGSRPITVLAGNNGSADSHRDDSADGPTLGAAMTVQTPSKRRNVWPPD